MDTHSSLDGEDAAVHGAGEATAKSMHLWRWLLFAAIFRFEVPEDVYLRIPNAQSARHMVEIR